MKQIFIYGDSLTWGIVPGTRERLPFDKRWPHVLEKHLNRDNENYRVIENCLNGRRTAWQDPFKSGRNGLEGIEQQMEIYSPLELVILMLGTNDFQSVHNNTAWHAAQGLKSLVLAIQRAPVEPTLKIPPILIIAPPEISEPRGDAVEKFFEGDDRCAGLAEEYSNISNELGCHFFDAGEVIKPSPFDGVHLDANGHHKLGDALLKKVSEILG